MAEVKNRVMVFIDNSNVFHSLRKLNKTGADYPQKYDPLELGMKLAGDRNLAGVMFYCAPSPSYLKTDGKSGEKRYWSQVEYYEAVNKIPNVELKYGYVSGPKGDTREKDVDTKIAVDMVLLASQNKYDVAILCSNDGDFQSAIKGTKELGKRVEVMYFKGSASLGLLSEADLSRRARKVFFKKLEKDKKEEENAKE